MKIDDIKAAKQALDKHPSISDSVYEAADRATNELITNGIYKITGFGSIDGLYRLQNNASE